MTVKLKVEPGRSPKEPTIFCAVCKKTVSAEGSVLGARGPMEPMDHYCAKHRHGIIAFEEMFDLHDERGV